MRLLFELGVEELPSRYVSSSEKSLLDTIVSLLKENRVEVYSQKSYSTPRRLAVELELSDKQEDLDEYKLGPAKSVALKEGVPTKALLGFLKSNNLSENDYTFIQTDKGEYVQIHKFLKGKETKEILVEIIKKAVNSLEFEKSMKWGSSSFRFVRPIKWLLCLVDDEVVDFDIEGIKTDNKTRGMRVFGSQELVVDNIGNYEQLLMDNFVIADRKKRQLAILESINKNCNTDTEIVDIDPKLLEEVTDLVEYPYAIKGDFNENYLNLPEELITITMKTHQRYFPVRFKDGKLSNHFVVIRNAPEYSEQVKKGNEKVIEPRLADSKFFFDEDLKINLEDNVEKLKNITFQKDMGTIYEKVQRAIKIAEFLGGNEDAKRSILLAKADLVSNVINEKEFTGLQGMMGSIYAKNSSENDIVSQAIEEHYRPRFQGDELPKSFEGSIAAIADKMDTAAGAFCVGLKPTGSKDPYAIRRAVQGAVAVALNIQLDFSYVELCSFAVDNFAKTKPILYNKAKEDLVEFTKQRLENILSEKYSKELISYVINIETNFKNLEEKLQKLSSFENTENFTNLINLLKRIKNIVKDNKSSEIKVDLFEDENESKVYNLIQKLENQTFSQSIDILISNANVINNFFDNVKINTEKEEITNNRIALLNGILKVVGEVIEV